MEFDLSEKMRKDFCCTYIGKKVPVLFEQQKDGMWCGLTENYLEVRAKGENLRGIIKDTEIKSFSDGFLSGKLTE